MPKRARIKHNLGRIENYQGIPLLQREAQVLRNLEQLVGEPIPLIPPGKLLITAFGFNAKNHHVSTLALYAKGVLELPEWLGELTTLTTLGLGENQLTTLPQSLTQLHNLCYLNLSDNPELGEEGAIEVGSTQCTAEDRKAVHQFLAHAFRMGTWRPYRHRLWIGSHPIRKSALNSKKSQKKDKNK